MSSPAVGTVETEAFFLANARLFGADYDGTEFITDELPPDGVDVNQAYGLGTDLLLGPTALEAWKAQGGKHKGRNPAEILNELLEYSDQAVIEEVITLEECGTPFDGILTFLARRTKAAVEPHPVDYTEAQQRSLVRVFTAAKLAPLIRQLGTKLDDGMYWPRPTPGFLGFSERLAITREQDPWLSTAVITAGHAEFITKTWDMYGLPYPDIFVDDDRVQAHDVTLTSEQRAKPSPAPMYVAMREWLVRSEISASRIDNPTFRRALGKRVLYIGDDTIKDLGMARTSGVQFVHLHHDASQAAWSDAADRLRLVPLHELSGSHNGR